MKETVKKISPQAGFQTDFLSSPADIVIGGGAAGSGKTYTLLLEALRNIHNSEFGGVIFRRTSPQVRSEGGLWDTAGTLFPIAGGMPKETNLEWNFRSGAKIKFSHLEYEKNILDWQGSQIPFIGFDELTHFSRKMFFYLLSRNRSTCGVRPYVRATCNPDPDSWVAKFISWWIDDVSGFPVPERAGKLRYFVVDGENVIWGDSKREVLERASHIIKTVTDASPETNPEDLVKSVTFIPGSIYANKELLRKDPGYLGNLLAQDEATKAQLLEGNWKVRLDGTEIINYTKFLDLFGNDFVSRGKRYITTDIALKGSDLLIIYVWDGFRLVDIDFAEKSKGDEVIAQIKVLAKKWQVPESRIVYDDDGVGQFIDGFIKNSNAFKNGSRPANNENYKNLKAQCYFKMADRINKDGYFIAPDVANRKVKGKTVKEHLESERRAIKQDKPDVDGKLCVIPKEQMKTIIGHSPDFWDAFMMREWFELFSRDDGMSANDIAGFF